jgi:hypothetical protein
MDEKNTTPEQNKYSSLSLHTATKTWQHLVGLCLERVNNDSSTVSTIRSYLVCYSPDTNWYTYILATSIYSRNRQRGKFVPRFHVRSDFKIQT